MASSTSLYMVDVARLLSFDKVNGGNEIASFLVTQNDVSVLKKYYSDIPPSITNNVLREDGILMLDLLINSIAVTQLERYKLVPYIGDWFDVLFFGAQPIVLNISAALLDLADSIGKDALLWVYENVLRASAVAKLNISPALKFRDLLAYGFLTNMVLQEDTHMTDIVKVSMSFITGEILQLPITFSKNGGNADKMELSLLGDWPSHNIS